MLNETEFNTLVDRTLQRIEDAIDASGADIDIDLNGGVLTLTFSNGSRIIVNRQTPNRELWVAARRGGFHFAWRDGDWRGTRDARPLDEVLGECVSEQTGTALQLDIRSGEG